MCEAPLGRTGPAQAQPPMQGQRMVFSVLLQQSESTKSALPPDSASRPRCAPPRLRRGPWPAGSAMRWSKNPPRPDPRSAFQPMPAALVQGGSNVLRSLPLRFLLQQPSPPPSIDEERHRNAHPTMEQVGRASIRLIPATAHITTSVTGAAPQAAVSSSSRHAKFGDATPAIHPRLGAYRAF